MTKSKTSDMNFGEMLDYVTDDIANKLKSDYVLLGYSGGIDSTALLLSFMKTKKPVYCVHVNSNKYCSDEFIFGDFMSYHICTILQVPLMIIPFDAYDPKYNFNHTFPIHGIYEYVNGDGMDRCFYSYNPKNVKSIGMDFRGMHPIIDALITSFGRIRNYKKTTYKERMTKENRLGDNIDKYFKAINLKIIKVSSHPVFKDFFYKNYKEDVKNIFFPKELTMNYVKENIGKSFNSIARETYRLNKDFLSPFGYRILRHMISRDNPNPNTKPKKVIGEK